MDSVALLDKVEVGGKLIKTLYLSILEKIRRKVFLDNGDELGDQEKFGAGMGVVDRDAGVVECEIGVNPEGEGVEGINSDVVVREEEEAVLLDEGSIGFEEVNAAV
jgi:hypothetical protein